MDKTGLLLINLGTPSGSDTVSVRRYLKEFLSDPRVIDIPSPARWLLLNAVILPFRPKKSAQAYQQIWSATKGSPLLFHSQALATALANKLGDNYQVALGMRYGDPCIASALDKLKHCTRLIVLPLFPQYSSAATGSALEKTLSLLAKQWNIPNVKIIKDFYSDSGFIQAYADVIRRTLAKQKIDKLIFSYHGLPERHLHKSGCQKICIGACLIDKVRNPYCYRQQCYITSHLIAEKLGLAPNDYCVSFQSRLGRTPWIKPYTDLLLPELIQQNIRNIAVVCPSFVADCLETLEEIAIRAKAQWQSLGGESFITIPCLNTDPAWVDALVELVT